MRWIDLLDNIQNQKVGAQPTANEKVAWAQSCSAVLDQLEVTPEKGLFPAEVSVRKQKFGLNQLRKLKKKSMWQILLNQLKSLIVALLAAAALISLIYGEMLEGWAILVVIIINTAIGFFTELKAVRSMEALFKLGKVKTRVRRNGEIIEVDAEELVPGDIVIIEGGDVITADLRLIESSKIQTNEATLTGESMPVEKSTEPVEEDAVVADRSCMLYKGTAVTRGSGAGVVLATGTNTELGQISSLVQEAKEEHTPLEERLDKLGYRLIGLTMVIVLFVTLAGIYHGKDIFLMIETGIALAVASIPEGLPIVATIALANGMHIMAEKNALVNRLSSVETLGTTGVIFTDKTGTLTENRMTVTHYLLPGRQVAVKTNGQVKFEEEGAKAPDPETDFTLKKADIGIAMGQRGTQVAKEAADMVLTDDAFSTIVLAVKQGRVIFENIRRFVYYLLSCNVSEVLIVGLATLLGAPLPLLPLQILFLNLVMDVFPALALGMGEAEEGVMEQQPRKADEPILTNKHWIGIGGYALVITGSVIGALYIGFSVLELDQTGAVTISFLTLAFAQLWHVFNMRSPASGVFNNTIVRNKWVWAAIALCLVITLAAVYIPPVAAVLKITVPSFTGWMVILGMSLIPLVLGQLQKILFKGRL